MPIGAVKELQLLRSAKKRNLPFRGGFDRYCYGELRNEGEYPVSFYVVHARESVAGIVKC